MAMKLFKSKKDGKEKKADKPVADTGSAKDGKKKRGGGDGGIGVLFANHVEKLLLVLAVVMAVMMVFSGFRNRSAIEGNKSPEDLGQQASRAVSVVNGGTWDDFRSDRDRDKHFLDRATETQENILVEAYATGQLIKPPLIPARTLRTDPSLLAPRDLHVTSGYGALAVKQGPNGSRDGQPGVRRVGQRRQQDDVAWKKYVRGTSGENTKGAYFAAVTALIPYREQLEAFKTLKNTVGYKPERDQPHFLMWVLRRAEVTGAENEKLAWKTIARSHTAARQAAQLWDGQGDEKRINPPSKYTDELLTFRVPPLLLDDLPRYTFHPAIPRELPKPVEPETAAPKTETPDEEDMWGGLESFQLSQRSEGERSGREDGPREREGSRESGREETPPQRDEFDAGDRVVNPPEYLMFRYFDLTVRPGRSYRYQLLLLLDDPNDPRKGGQFNPPDADTLDQTVSERLHKKRTGQSKIPFGRLAPPSEPSPVVYVGRGERMLAGKVTPSEMVTIRDQGQFAREEPAAKVMVMTFQPTNGADIPAVKDFHRGSVGNFVETVKYWPPAGEFAQSAENHDFNTDLLVLDIRGGDPLADSGIANPGEILIFNRDGRMEVIDELRDARIFESRFVPPIEETVEERPRDREREGSREDARRGGGGRGPRGGARGGAPGREAGSNLFDEGPSGRGEGNRRGGRGR